MWESNEFDELKACVIIPTYNNCKTLGEVIERVGKYTRNIIVVNDGSTDQTARILSHYESTIELVTHTKNQGKGRALRNGFQRALELGYENAITLDSDGQHFPEDLPRLLQRMRQAPGAIIIGARNMAQENVPGGSSFGNRFSNFWFWVETGIRLPDTQSGYRVYPIRLLSKYRFFCTKFEYEIEVPVRAAWGGIPVVSEPVQIKYEKGGERVTHFRPFWDFFRISVLNTILCVIAFSYIKPRDFFKNLTWENIRKFIQIKNETNFNIAASVGFGIFMGIVPIWGYQMIAALGLAYLFKLHKPVVILAANISIPPMIPLIVFGSLATGSLVMGRPLEEISFSQITGLETIARYFTQYVIGSLVLATFSGLVSGVFSYLFLLIFRRK